MSAQRVAFLVMVAFFLLAPAVIYPVFLMKVMCFALFACAFNLLIGYGGLLSFGHAMFIGTAGYASAHAAKMWGFTPELAILFGTGCSALLGLLTGLLAIRRQGIYFAMITLALAQMLYFFYVQTPFTHGEDGIQAVPRGRLFGLLDLSTPLTMYYFVLACLVVVFGFLALLLRSRFGRALAGIKANEVRMRATGFSTYPYKLAAFVISGAIAGLSGFLFAVKDGFVNPELLSWHLSGAVLIMIILGGLGHLRGAVIGAFAYALLQELFKSEAIFGAFAKHWLLGMGLAIIACVALLPHGLIGVADRLKARRAPQPVQAT